RSVQSCRLDLRRWGASYVSNAQRPHYEGHERPMKGQSKGLFVLAKELGLNVPQKCKLQELKSILSSHSAFKNVTKLEKLAATYNVKIIFTPKYHCECNAFEGVCLISESRIKFIEKETYKKLFRRFWKTLKAYQDGKDYKEVLCWWACCCVSGLVVRVYYWYYCCGASGCFGATPGVTRWCRFS
ncbi:unnamed protein product, partial [Didymodactylos carnosus]